MYPPELPPRDGRKPPKPSNPEREVFRLIERALDDFWLARYSFRTLTKDDKHGTTDDETDFVLLHPEHGIICIEVKGRVRRHDGQWEEPDGKDKWRRAKTDPVDQMTSHYHTVLNLVSRELSWKKHEIRISRLIIFTGRDFQDDGDITPELPRHYVLDKFQINNQLESALIEATARQRSVRDQTKPPGAEGIAELHELICQDISAEPDAKTRAEKDTTLQTILTEQQVQTHSGLRESPRAAVIGCAGSGKTVIAKRLARDVADSGKKVLFTCFNEALANDLNSRTRNDNITIVNFHSLCREMATEAGLEVPPAPAKNAEPAVAETYYWYTLPLLLKEAFELLGSKYDAIIVDEAQDFHPDVIGILDDALNPEDGKLWLFLDESQAVYSQRFVIPDNFARYPLVKNCRNTKAIHAEVQSFYRGSLTLESQGPDGGEVERYPDVESQAAKVASLIEHLVEEEGFSVDEIVVLSLHRLAEEGDQKSDVVKAPGRYRYVHGPSTNGGEVRFASIAGFKGLESKIVIACELDHIKHGDRSKLLYVAFSRATSRLIIVGPLPEIETDASVAAE
jgi:superfamily I DNA/RNA helicase